ncbi:hypothetical protein ACO1O0_002813 [Amphichorda felina]
MEAILLRGGIPLPGAIALPDAIPPEEFLPDPNVYSGLRLLSQADDRDPSIPRYRLVSTADDRVITECVGAGQLWAINRRPSRGHMGTGNRLGLVPASPHIQLKVLARATHLFNGNISPGSLTHMVANFGAAPIGLHATTLQPVFMTARRWTNNPKERDEWAEKDSEGDNLRGPEFKLSNGQSVSSHILLFEDMAVPGNMSSLKAAIENEDLSCLVGNNFHDQESVQRAFYAGLADVREGMFPRSVSRVLAAPRFNLRNMPDKTQLHRAMSAPNPHLGQSRVLSGYLPITRNYLYHGHIKPQVYVHRVPLLSNMEFKPRVYDMIHRIATYFPQDIFPKDLVLHWMILWKDVTEATWGPPERSRLGRTAQDIHRVPLQSVIRVIVNGMHFYRWHEQARVLSFTHPFTWTQAVMETDYRVSKAYRVPDNLVDEDELLRLLNDARPINPEIPASTRIELWPSQLPGSELAQPSDIPRLNKTSVAMMGLSSVFLAGLPSYQPRLANHQILGMPASYRDHIFFTGQTAAVESPLPDDYIEKVSDGPVALAGLSGNDGPLIWDLGIRHHVPNPVPYMNI